MAKCDEIFKKMCTDIIENGVSTEGEKVRPRWEDGTPAYTLKKFGVVNEYDLREEFPLQTLRPVGFKSCIDEVLWIFQRKSNNINDLKPHIWDEWADETGSIGKAYGYQVAQLSQYKDGMMDQMDALLHDLKKTPYSRRMLMELYNHKDLHEMNLYPCCHLTTWNVTDEGGDKLVLNMILNQRSADLLAAGAWNVAQYAGLLMMVAQAVNMVPGKMIHVIADAHIYDRHIPLMEELVSREAYPAAKVILNPYIEDFYAFEPDDFVIENYQHGPQIKNIPIAV